MDCALREAFPSFLNSQFSIFEASGLISVAPPGPVAQCPIKTRELLDFELRFQFIMLPMPWPQQ